MTLEAINTIPIRIRLSPSVVEQVSMLLETARAVFWMVNIMKRRVIKSSSKHSTHGGPGNPAKPSRKLSMKK
jgi:hypothetical protein